MSRQKKKRMVKVSVYADPEVVVEWHTEARRQERQVSEIVQLAWRAALSRIMKEPTPR